jgi:phasin family protein
MSEHAKHETAGHAAHAGHAAPAAAKALKKSAPKALKAKKPAAKKAKPAAAKAAPKSNGAKKPVDFQAYKAFGRDARGAAEEMFQFSKHNKTMESLMFQGKDQFEKYTQEATRAGKEHAAAIMESGNILMKGAEDVMKTWINWAQSSAERNSDAVKELLGCRTLNEFAETQNRLAQESFDDFVAGATRVSELSVKLATDAFEPINDQFSKNIRKAEKRAA